MNITSYKSLRTKMLLALAAGMLLLFALIFFVARTVLLDGYSKLEKDKTNIQINSAISLLKEQSLQLSTNVRDYAHWDDMYAFVQNKNPTFVEVSLSDTVFSNFKLSALLIINSEGEAVYQRGIDYTNGKPWRIPDLILQATRKGGVLTDPAKNDTSGLFWTPQGIFIVSAIDIIDSNENKPRRGTLIMLRLLDEPLIQHIQTILGAKISVQGMREDEIAVLSPNLIKGEKVVMPMTDSVVYGFALLETIGGDNRLLLSTTGDRKIFEQGQSSLKFLYWASLLTALLLVAFSWLLNKLVLAPLAHLNVSVKNISNFTTIGQRVSTLNKGDEIDNLTLGINGMLDRLDASQHALMLEKERAQVTLAGIADAVITCDNTGHVLYMNAAAEQLTGVAAATATGRALQSLFHLLKEDHITAVDSAWLTDANSIIDEVMLARADGRFYNISKSTSALYDNYGQHFSTVIVLHDVTALRELSSQITYQACHDQLTGLVNRYEFERKMQQAIEDTRSEGRTQCLAYFDLDQFKIVNDSCGHMAGDLLLQQLSELLKTKVRGSDTFARLGGDEFALLLTGCSVDKARTIIDGMLKIVREYRFNFEDKVFKVGVSIGLLEITAHNTLALDELLSMVDSACYVAKEHGGNRYHLYQNNGGEVKERNSQIEWISRIHTALEKNQFVLYAQCLHGFSDTAEAHCEVLIRMQGKEGVLYPPGAFLPAAERYNLMPQIDRWVINKALSVIASKGIDFIGVCAINLSGQSLSDDGFLDYILDQIKLHGVNTSKLCFEITETAAITNLSKARLFMQALRKIGCRFSLDDFGSGFSSFAYLKNLEVDFIKIDGMFVKSIAHNTIDQTMVESINNIGHVMGLHTIAEFAENDVIINRLKEIGVDYAQGYGVAMPVLFE